nr:glycoside hydrolase domain-containing protein [Mesorhizobium sp. LNHC220B00]
MTAPAAGFAALWTMLAMGGWAFFPIYNGGDLKDMMLKPKLGEKHGLKAARFMHASGFAEGSIVYLDIEKPADRAQLSPYIENWIAAVKGNSFYPGVGSTGHCNTLCSLSAGVSKSRVFRGR